MEPLKTATYGAKIQSFRSGNPRDLLRRIIEEDPSASKVELLKACRDEIIKDEDMVDAVIEYWFSNNYHSLIGQKSTTCDAQQKRRQSISEVATNIKERIEERAQMLLLDMILPNGKALRDCTGRECANLGNRIGQWLKRVSAEIRPTQRVGDALSEERVRQLYQMRSSRT